MKIIQKLSFHSRRKCVNGFQFQEDLVVNDVSEMSRFRRTCFDLDGSETDSKMKKAGVKENKTSSVYTREARPHTYREPPPKFCYALPWLNKIN